MIIFVIEIYLKLPDYMANPTFQPRFITWERNPFVDVVYIGYKVDDT